MYQTYADATTYDYSMDDGMYYEEPMDMGFNWFDGPNFDMPAFNMDIDMDMPEWDMPAWEMPTYDMPPMDMDFKNFKLW
jgi:hypothetical protein